MTNKRKKNISYNEIRSLSEDWALDERNGFPYSGESVQAFIKKVFGRKAGDFYFDVNRYLVFADAESRETYLEDPDAHADLLLGVFDAPANYTAEIILATPSFNAILEGATGNYIDFTFDIVNRSGGKTGEPVLVTYTFNNGGNVKTVTQVYEAETNVHFLVDDYLSAGANRISIVLTGKTNLASVMVSVNYTVVALKISSPFQFTTPVERGNYLSIPYTIKGAGLKYIEWYIDGTKESFVDTVSEIEVTRTKNLTVDELSYGKHNVQIRPYTVVNGSSFYGETLYFDFLVCPVGEAWDIQTTHLTYTLLALSLAEPCLTAPSIQIRQYEKVSYKLGLYDYRRRVLPVNVLDNAVVVQSLSMAAFDITSKEYIPTTVGNHTLSFDAGENAASFVVVANENDMGVREEPEDVLLKLTAKGRNNNEVNPAVWTYQEVAATFSGINWDSRGGWIGDALVIPAGGYVDIPFAALGNNPVTKGRTIEIEYEVADVENDDASVLSLINSSTNAGLEITATSAKLQSSGGAQVNTKFRDGDRLRLSFIINRAVGDNSLMMFIVNNGILERAANFASTDNFNVAGNLRFGSAGCIVKIYNILVYDKALTIEQAFGNFAVNAENVLSVVDRNDVLSSVSGLLDADKVNTKLPVLIITGNMQPIFDATDKNTTVYVDVDFLNQQDNTKNFHATHVRVRPQGTSSLGYPRKNLRLYTSDEYDCVMKDENGDVIPNGKYAFKDNAQPVDCWTLKADYAESSGSHNTGVARLWNRLMYNAQVDSTFPLRTTAQTTALANHYDKDVRTAIDGFPIVVFYHLTETDELTCLGQYNFNNDKSTESVFGFVDIPGFDNSHVQCFEVLGNEEPLALFTDIDTFDSQWSKAYESRYPDTKTPNLSPLKRLCTWVHSCQNNQSKWNNEKSLYFDIPKLAAYYVYLMRFGAVDQPVKNSMLTTEDGEHWFFINYDNDTVLGIDNISTVLNRWDYDRQTAKVGGGYIYAGHESVLWNCFEADSECQAMVRTIDDALYSAGLTYNELIKTFDEEQCDKWCERIYNDNGVYKYILPYREKGAPVLYMLQGNRKSYRHWWLKNRMEMCDAMWATGAYKNRIVRFIAEGAPSGSQFTIGAKKSSYFGYGINAVAQEIGVAVEKDALHEFTISQALAIGDPISIYNASNLSVVDLSEVCSYLTTLYLQQAVDNNGKSSITKLILGDGSHNNVKFTEIGGLSVITTLEEIDIRGFWSMHNIDLSALPNLHVFKALGSGLTSFAPAAGCSLTNVELPSSVQAIVLDGCSVASMTVEDFDDAEHSSLHSITMRNVSGAFNAQSFVQTWLNTYTAEQLADFSITLAGINWSGMTVEQVLKLAAVGTHNLQGRVTLTSMNATQYQQIVDTYGEDVFDPNGIFVIDAPAGIYFSAPESLLEGHSVTLRAVAFPVGSPIVYHLYDSNESEASPDSEGIAHVGNVTLDVNTGVLTAGSMTQDTIVGVRAVSGSSISELCSITVRDITTMGGIESIDGNKSYDAPGTYPLTIVPTNPQFNVPIHSIEVHAQVMSDLLRFTSDTANLKVFVEVLGIPANYTLTQGIQVVVTDNAGNEYSAIVMLSINVNRITDFTITGPDTIVSKGSYQYTLTDLLPANHNKDIQSLTVTEASSPGLIIISGITTSAFTMNVVKMPDATSTVSLTVTATLDNGDTISRTKFVSLKIVNNLGILDELEKAIMHKNGNFYTRAEWQSSGFTLSDVNGIAVSDAKTNPSNPHRIVALVTQRVTRNWSTSAQLVGNTDVTSWNSEEETQAIITKFGAGNAPAAEYCQSVTSSDGNTAYLPTFAEFDIMWPALAHFQPVFNFSAVDIYAVATTTESDAAHIKLKGADSYAIGERGKKIDANSTLSGDQMYITIPFAKIKPIPLNKPIDLGLPSGRLWSNVNLDAASAEESGLYYQWGNLDGHSSGDGYDFSAAHYAETPGSQISSTIPLANDAANAKLGGCWHIPTEADFEELFDNNNTTRSWITLNNVGGWRITSKSNGNSIFLPVVGFIDANGESQGKTSNGYYWSSSPGSTLGTGIHTAFNSSTLGYNTATGGNIGMAIRPVLDPPVLSGDSRISDGTHNYTIENLDDIASIAASVSTPSSGTISVAASGTTTVVLTITEAPSVTQDVTLTVVATLTNGDTVTLTKTVTIVVVRVIMTSATNPDVLAVCYAQGWCADSTKMTEEEAAAVTSIGQVFKNNTNIRHFEEFEYFTGVKILDSRAFSSCSNLTSITIPNSVTSIGSFPFQNCTSLTSVTIGSGVSNIGSSAFSGCSSLTAVHINDIAAWCKVNFYDSSSNPLYYAKHLYLNGEELEDLTIPNNVTSIGKYAFQNCTSLTSVTIPEGVTNIGDFAFFNCSGLTSITIPESVTIISNSAFSYCSGLTSIIVEEGNSKYDSRDNCNAIIVTATSTLIAGCKNTIIPNSVTKIGDYAFESCSGLTSITFPSSVTSIGNYAFRECRKLSNITCLRTTAPSISNYTFSNVATDSSVTTKTLNVPAGATGYDSGNWKAQLIDKGFTLNATL